jgi:hypothetical protein
MCPNLASIMPQAIAVWCEEFGHEVFYETFTGSEDLTRALPRDVDLLFMCSFTRTAYLAYAVSNLFRRRGVVTVLGGPHARAYPEDSASYFDYVVGYCDRALVRDLLQGFASQPRLGLPLGAKRHPECIPGLQERWSYVRHNLAKASFLLAVVPMVASLGCPYRCSFCIDAEVDYQPLPYGQLHDDLAFLARQRPAPTGVGWHDPNFGVRFDDYLGVIEEAVPPGALSFIGETNLSTLSERNLERFRRNHFKGVIIGIEDWYGFGGKTGHGRVRGRTKADAVAEHIDVISRYIPYVQSNFVVGLDEDSGPEPFELVKHFLERAPATYPAFSLLTAFGSTAPLNRALERDGRVIAAPFPLQDTASLHNVPPKNYTLVEFYDRLFDLLCHAYSPRRTWHQFRSSTHPLSSGPRWMGSVRSAMSKARAVYYRRIRDLLATDPTFHAFCEGSNPILPRFFSSQIAAELGPFYTHLPSPVLDYLEGRAGWPKAA